ncbi:MAG: 3-hydroxyacyl-CoA dehydrogenase family protein [Proteobacteria bacterium]|nr:3-hydroxyacyl-CoA dehydrogenase family protein [Pseudomonadota bacterium]
MMAVREGAGFTRDEMVRHLESRRIQTRMLFSGNLTRQPALTRLAEDCAARGMPAPYRVAGDLERTDFVMNQGFWIGVFPGMTEAMLAAAEGVPLETIDAAAIAFGMPKGPIELADMVGLDVALQVGSVLSAAFGTPRPTILEPLVAAGKLGQKTGTGLYAWRDGRPVRPLPSASAPADLADRLILPMLNEAVACLREGIVADEDLLDAGIVFGTGFAPFRGGPLQYARRRGLVQVVARLHELEARYGARFHPDSHWANLAP